ncbi:hypothetical protein D3C84_1052680 [compost metagenome]
MAWRGPVEQFPRQPLAHAAPTGAALTLVNGIEERLQLLGNQVIRYPVGHQQHAIARLAQFDLGTAAQAWIRLSQGCRLVAETFAPSCQHPEQSPAPDQ